MAKRKVLTPYQAWKLEGWFMQTIVVIILGAVALSLFNLGMWAFTDASVDARKVFVGLAGSWCWLEWIYWRRRAREAERQLSATAATNYGRSQESAAKASMRALRREPTGFSR